MQLESHTFGELQRVVSGAPRNSQVDGRRWRQMVILFVPGWAMLWLERDTVQFFVPTRILPRRVCTCPAPRCGLSTAPAFLRVCELLGWGLRCARGIEAILAGDLFGVGYSLRQNTRSAFFGRDAFWPLVSDCPRSVFRLSFSFSFLKLVFPNIFINEKEEQPISYVVPLEICRCRRFWRACSMPGLQLRFNHHAFETMIVLLSEKK